MSFVETTAKGAFMLLANTCSEKSIGGGCSRNTQNVATFGEFLV